MEGGAPPRSRRQQSVRGSPARAVKGPSRRTKTVLRGAPSSPPASSTNSHRSTSSPPASAPPPSATRHNTQHLNHRNSVVPLTKRLAPFDRHSLVTQKATAGVTKHDFAKCQLLGG